MKEIKKVFFANYLVTLAAQENDLLLFNGDQFIWAFDAMAVNGAEKFRWEGAYYFDNYQMVPPLAEIKKYYDQPFCIKEGLSFAIDAENNRAVLQGSNFHYEERPINKRVLIPDSIEYQGILYPVTAVADWGFYNDTSVTDLILPETITQIGNYAFANSIIKDVKMSPDLIMGNNVFYGCDHLNEQLKDVVRKNWCFDHNQELIKKEDVDYMKNLIERIEQGGINQDVEEWYHDAVLKYTSMCENYAEQNPFEKALNAPIRNDQEQQLNAIKKGDVFQTDASSQMIVLDVKGTDALLFTGKHFIQATNIRLEDNRLQWDESAVYAQFSNISGQHHEESVEDDWEQEM
ncbi:leucine-rich repeat protein [Acetobacterium bakii]|uniref:Cell surface protein n=1 Tax=Acetobacterium bakii TaxID=52689 RepID=A0A0L6U1P9_9FIRM|nr:leucine-rich repeat protein [Acetobacterium bakii]KNZ42431.1 hypothetical protein AKG39_06625 [Acetobacterium bakii]